jgi:hypothetical protein
MKIKWEGVVQSLIVALLLAIFGAAFQTYTEVKMLRVEVDRLNVYVDQLWKQK